MLEEVKSINEEIHQSFVELKEFISEEIKLYENLRDVMLQKQKAIIDNNLTELRRTVELEQTLIQDCKDRAERLKIIITNLAPNEGKPQLKEIIKKAPENLRIGLERARKRLIVSLEEISQINQENRFLLNFSLEHIKGVINLLLKTEDENAKVYNYRGHIVCVENSQKTLNVQI